MSTLGAKGPSVEATEGADHHSTSKETPKAIEDKVETIQKLETLEKEEEEVTSEEDEEKEKEEEEESDEEHGEGADDMSYFDNGEDLGLTVMTIGMKLSTE